MVKFVSYSSGVPLSIIMQLSHAAEEVKRALCRAELANRIFRRRAWSQIGTAAEFGEFGVRQTLLACPDELLS
jgi:hypothetical protein